MKVEVEVEVPCASEKPVYVSKEAHATNKTFPVVSLTLFVSDYLIEVSVCELHMNVVAKRDIT